MKKYLLILAALFFPLWGWSQNKTQVLTDLQWTLDEFQAAINTVVDEQDHIPQYITTIAQAFGSSEYFFHNSQRQPSFDEWLYRYYCTWEGDTGVMHTFLIRQQTVTKVEPDKVEDMRWRFDADLTRLLADGREDKKVISFIVQWAGEGRYTPILEIDGDMFFQSHPTQVIVADVSSAVGVTSFDYQDTYYSFHSLTLVRKDGKYGFIHKDGTVIVPPIYDEVGCMGLDNESLNDQCSWLNSIALMSVKKDGKWGYVDVRGRVVVPPAYDYVQKSGMYNGLPLWVAFGGRYGCIDQQGQSIVPCLYEAEINFDTFSSLAAAKRFGKWGFVNIQGKVVIAHQYDRAGRFRDSCAPVLKDGRLGYINLTGQPVIPFVYDVSMTNFDMGLYNFKGGAAAVSKGGKWGLINTRGETVLPFKYDELYNVLFSGFEFRLDGKTALFDFLGNEYSSETDLYEHSDSIQAGQGRIQSMYVLGKRHYHSEDYARASVWLHQAYDKGLRQAALYLGFIYYYGHGSNQDWELAHKYFLTAAETGDLQACSFLAHMYQYGQGISKSLSKAIEWYCKCNGYNDSYHKVEELDKQYACGYGYVDLGLSVKWATCNIGASSPEQLGDTFAWGETEPNRTFTKKSSYTYNKKHFTNIAGWFDAAQTLMKGEWRMPTHEEMNELIDKCHWETVFHKGAICAKITGPNGRFIYMPGMFDTHSIHYWSADGFDKKQAYFLYIDTLFDIRKGTLSKERYLNAYIRPVIK